VAGDGTQEQVEQELPVKVIMVVTVEQSHDMVLAVAVVQG
jgi:hypothetical protein